MDNTMAKIDNTHIELLTEENFSSWFVDVRARLRTKKLWKYTQSAFKTGGNIVTRSKEDEKEEDPPFKTIPKEKKKVVSHVF